MFYVEDGDEQTKDTKLREKVHHTRDETCTFCSEELETEFYLFCKCALLRFLPDNEVMHQWRV